jgi:hypothetical protein
MSQFLKMRNVLINTRSIEKVEMFPTAYRVFLTNYKPDGFSALGFGYIRGTTTYYQVDKDAHPEDYKMVSDWITTLK